MLINSFVTSRRIKDQPRNKLPRATLHRYIRVPNSIQLPSSLCLMYLFICNINHLSATRLWMRLCNYTAAIRELDVLRWCKWQHRLMDRLWISVNAWIRRRSIIVVGRIDPPSDLRSDTQMDLTPRQSRLQSVLLRQRRTNNRTVKGHFVFDLQDNRGRKQQQSLPIHPTTSQTSRFSTRQCSLSFMNRVLRSGSAILTAKIVLDPTSFERNF